MKHNLKLASLYLVAFEFLKTSILDNLLGLISMEYQQGKTIKNSDYKYLIKTLNKKYTEFKGKNEKDEYRASCLWFMESEAISRDDVDKLLDIREHRNLIAHELANILFDDNENININFFTSIYELIKKIDVWWIINIENTTTYPGEFDNINKEEIKSGRMLAMEFLIQNIILEDLKK